MRVNLRLMKIDAGGGERFVTVASADLSSVNNEHVFVNKDDVANAIGAALSDMHPQSWDQAEFVRMVFENLSRS